MAIKVITVQEDILRANDQIAGLNENLLKQKNVTMINIMASPGAGSSARSAALSISFTVPQCKSNCAATLWRLHISRQLSATAAASRLV